MVRIQLVGPDLGDFSSLGFDDHLKIFDPTPSGEWARRDYTPRRYDRATRTKTATHWARAARTGDVIKVAGAKGSKVTSPTIQRWLRNG